MQRWHRGGRRAFGPSAKVMSADPEIEETVAAAVAASLVPGLASALVEDGGVSWAGGFRGRNAAGSDPIDADTIFAVASPSKPPFAYLVLKLAASVDARTRSFLAHTSGIGNWDEGEGEPGTWRYSGEAICSCSGTSRKRPGDGWMRSPKPSSSSRSDSSKRATCGATGGRRLPTATAPRRPGATASASRGARSACTRARPSTRAW